MSTLVLPDPCLVVLVGAAGSGKSTLAARCFTTEEILSSDAVRLAVAGDEADQRASAIAFRILFRTLDRRMTEGRSTVIDATNTIPAHRRPILARAQAAGVPTVAVVLDLPPATVLAQNARRTARIVDREVVERHLAAVRRTVDSGQLTMEGFDHVVLLRTASEAAALRVERRAQPAGTTRSATRPNARARTSTHTPLRR